MAIQLHVEQKFLNSDSFTGQGMILKLNGNPTYGPHPKFKDEKTGEPRMMYGFKFVDQKGSEKEFETGSQGFAIAFNQAQINVGDWMHISRNGSGFSIKYYIAKIAPADQQQAGVATQAPQAQAPAPFVPTMPPQEAFVPPSAPQAPTGMPQQAPDLSDIPFV